MRGGGAAALGSSAGVSTAGAGLGWAGVPQRVPAVQLLGPRQAVPGEVSPQDGYVLLLALLSIFIGGTLVLLSGILIICRRCCEADRRHSRWAGGDAAVSAVCGTARRVGGAGPGTSDPPPPAEPAMTPRKPTPLTWMTRSQRRVSDPSAALTPPAASQVPGRAVRQLLGPPLPRCSPRPRGSDHHTPFVLSIVHPWL